MCPRWVWSWNKVIRLSLNTGSSGKHLEENNFSNSKSLILFHLLSDQREKWKWELLVFRWLCWINGFQTYLRMSQTFIHIQYLLLISLQTLFYLLLSCSFSFLFLSLFFFFNLHNLFISCSIAIATRGRHICVCICLEWKNSPSLGQLVYVTADGSTAMMDEATSP